MKTRRRKWILLSLLVVIATTGLVVMDWKLRQDHWSDYNLPVVFHQWTIALPRGGSVTYKDQGPRTRPMIGPADTEKILIWVRPDGQSQEYPMGRIGGGYDDIEFRLGKDGNDLYIIAWGIKIAGALNLKSGRFISGGGDAFDWGAKGYSDSEQPGLPGWNTVRAGRSLGRRKFN